MNLSIRRFSRIISTSIFSICVSSSAYSLTLEELENKVSEQSRLIEQLSSGLGEGGSDRITINGFISASASRLFMDEKNRDAGVAFDRFAPLVDKSTGFERDNVAGLQFNAKLSNDFSATVQLLGTGANQFDVTTELAYIAWEIDANLTARAGKLRTPFYFMSEYLEVGTSYVYARPPSEIYSIAPINSIRGLDFLYRFYTGDWNHTLQLGFGRLTGATDKVISHLDVKNASMANISSTVNNLTLRASYFAARITIDKGEPFPGTGEVIPGPQGELDINNDSVKDFSLIFPAQSQNADQVHFGSIGGLYDDGNILVASEVVAAKVRGFWPSSESWNLTFGKHIGKWLAYVAYSEVEDTDSENRKVGLLAVIETADAVAAIQAASGGLTLALGDQIPGALISPLLVVDARRGVTVNQTTYTLGVNYNINDHVVFKMQADQTKEFDHTLGLFAVENPDAFTGKHINMLTFTVDASF